MMTKFVPAFFVSCLLLPGLSEGVRSSEDYEVIAETGEGGGGQSASANYSVNSNTGGIAGNSGASLPAVLARAGYPAQLYELLSLSVLASPVEVDEGLTSQLSAMVTLDDTSILRPAAANVVWSVLSGPVDSISNEGVATAGFVYENELASLQGEYTGVSGSGFLTILDADPDNFGSYSGDGIDDDWQVGYFGLPPNEDAAPEANPDGDTDDNEMEFLTGFDPTDPGSAFQFVILGKSGGEVILRLNRVIPGRSYTLLSGPDLTDINTVVEVLTVESEELQKTLLDPAPASEPVFYEVDVSRP